MSENLESFVKKLQSEGIDAARDAAEKLRKEAQEKADDILACARREAEEIVQQAMDEGDRRRDHARAELEMAVRDVVLQLRESLSQALSAVISHRVSEGLDDTNYLRQLIRDVVTAYAEADAGLSKQAEVRVSKGITDAWMRDLIKDLSEQLHKPDDAITVKAVLSRSGFEYRVDGATVEVTPESVTEILLEMVNPELQGIITQALAGETG